MRNKWKNAWKEICGNRGSGVVLVLVAISCITLMSVSLLHLSYTAFKMKAAERQGKIDFYMAEIKADELLAGVQVQVSNAIAEAQKKTLMNYQSPRGLAAIKTVSDTVSGGDAEAVLLAEEGETPESLAGEGGTSDPSTEGDETPESSSEEGVTTETVAAETLKDQTVFDAEVTEIFQGLFLDQLEAWAKEAGSGTTSDGSGVFSGTYDRAILTRLYSSHADVTDITFLEDGTYVKDTTTGQFILQNVVLTHTSEKSGYVTHFKFDIVIRVPDFFYIQEGDSAGFEHNPSPALSASPDPDASPAPSASPVTDSWNIEDLITLENWSTY